MHKRIIAVEDDLVPEAQDWLDLKDLVEVEMTSEDPGHPIESALLTYDGSGWRASEPGTQTIRLNFTEPRLIRRIRLVFSETAVDRTQEYVLRWSKDTGQSFKEIVRQQWNFSPLGAQIEMEDHYVELPGVTALELMITPDIKDPSAMATLKQLQLA